MKEETFEDLREQWEAPEFWHLTVLAYIKAQSEEEFEKQSMDDVIIVPVVGGEYSITKGNLIKEAQQEVLQYREKYGQ